VEITDESDMNRQEAVFDAPPMAVLAANARRTRAAA
jgi:hypothetical protein